MNTSESIAELSKALVEFHGSVGKVKKDSKNPHFKSSYASLSGILDAITEPLTAAGLCVVQLPVGRSGLTTRLCHESGQWIEQTFEMPPVQATPQGTGSAITYQRRYALCALLSLNVDDDDGHAGSSGKAAAIVPAAKPTPAIVKKAPVLDEEHAGYIARIEQICKAGKESGRIPVIRLDRVRERWSEIRADIFAANEVCTELMEKYPDL